MAQPWVRGAGALGLSQYLGAGLGIITMLAATRLLGPEGYGAAAVAMSYPALVWTLIGVKPASVTTRYAADFRGAGRKGPLLAVCRLTYLLDLSIAALAALLTAASSGWVARALYGRPDIAGLMALFSLSFPFCALTSTSTSLLLVWERPQQVAVLQALQRGLTFLLVTGSLLAGAKESGVVLGTALAQVAVGIAAFAAMAGILRAEAFEPVHRGLDLGELAPLRGEIGSLLGWNYLIVTAGGLLTQAPVLLLGQQCGMKDAGYFRVASSLLVVCAYIESSLTRISYPELAARLGAEGAGAVLSGLWRRSLPPGLLAASPMLAAMLVLPALLPRLLGAGYAPMLPGAELMLASAALGALFFWLWPLYFAAGRLDLWSLATLLQVAVLLGLGWFLQKSWAFFGMAVSFCLAKALFVAAMAYRARHLKTLGEARASIET